MDALYPRLDRYAEERVSCQHALSLTAQPPERRFLRQRLSELPG
jgi:predicted RNA polymerase sigma factor